MKKKKTPWNRKLTRALETRLVDEVMCAMSMFELPRIVAAIARTERISRTDASRVVGHGLVRLGTGFYLRKKEDAGPIRARFQQAIQSSRTGQLASELVGLDVGFEEMRDDVIVAEKLQ